MHRLAEKAEAVLILMAVEHHRVVVLPAAVILRVEAPAEAPVEVRLRLAEDLRKVETRPEIH